MNEKLADKKILFVGLNTVDLQFLVGQYPGKNTKTKASHHEINVGGPATNAAIACAHLGEEVDLMTPIGCHALSDFIKEDILNNKVHLIDPIINEKSEPTFASIITSEDTGDRTVISYRPLIEILTDQNDSFDITEYKLLMLDGFHPELALKLAILGRTQGITSVMDCGSWKPGMEELLKYVDIAICSNEFKMPGNSETNSILESLHNYGVSDCAITRGKESIIYSNSGGRGELHVENIEAVDTLGAGDFFHGAFSYYFARQNTFITALEKASKIAAQSCLSFGTRKWMENK